MGQTIHINSFKSQIQMINSHIQGLSNSSTASLDKLSELLTSLMYDKYNENDVNQSIQKKLDEMVRNYFSESKYTEKYIMRYNERGLQATPKTVSVKKIDINLLREYINDIEKIISKGSIDQDQASEILTSLKQINDNYNGTFTQDQKKSIANKINTLLKMQSLPISKATGDLFEIWFQSIGNYVDGRIEQITANVTDDIVKSSLKSYSSKTAIDFTNFNKDIQKRLTNNDAMLKSLNSKNLKNTWTLDTEDGKSGAIFKTTHSTLDKMDAEIKVNDNLERVSLKNYALRNDDSIIHLLSGTPLVTLLSNYNVKFVTDWIRLVYPKNSDKNNEKYTSDDNFTEAQKIMKYSILASALTGYGTSALEHEAGILILNARSKSKVYVISIQQLLEKILNDLNNIHLYAKIENFPEEKSQDYLNMTNTNEQVAKVLLELASKRISVSATTKTLPVDKV